MRIALAVPDRHVTPEFIEAALEATTIANQELLRDGVSPTASQVMAAGAKWRPEPRSWGEEHFDLIPTVAGRGWGDCDDWAPGVAAELRHTGADPGARAIIRRSGAKSWHALVQKSDGTIIDPSSWAGMPSGRVPRVRQRLPDGIAGIAVVPNGRRGWFARCDLPVDSGHLVGVGWAAPSPQAAIWRSVCSVAPSHCMGQEVAGILHEHVVGFDLGDLGALAGGAAGFAAGGPAGAAAGAKLGSMAGSAAEGAAATHGGAGDMTPEKLQNLINAAKQPGMLQMSFQSLLKQMGVDWNDPDAVTKFFAATTSPATSPATPAPAMPTNAPVNTAVIANGAGTIAWGPGAPVLITFTPHVTRL